MIEQIMFAFALIGILVVTAVFGFIGFIFAQIIREYIFDIRLSMSTPLRCHKRLLRNLKRR
jgi:hypothetical protein